MDRAREISKILDGQFIKYGKFAAFGKEIQHNWDRTNAYYANVWISFFPNESLKSVSQVGEVKYIFHIEYSMSKTKYFWREELSSLSGGSIHSHIEPQSLLVLAEQKQTKLRVYSQNNLYQRLKKC